MGDHRVSALKSSYRGDVMKEIRLSLSNSGWSATWLVDGQPDADVVALFNTHTIPTAFTRHAEESEVIRALAALNPEHVIVGSPCRDFVNHRGE